MIQIKPIKHLDISKFPLKELPEDFVPEIVIWQGVHICIRGKCANSGDHWLIDLPVKHGFITPSSYNTTQKKIFTNLDTPIKWYTDMFLKIEDAPINRELQLKIRGKATHKNVIVLNCVDGWYGHSLLSILHLFELLKQKPIDTDIILIIQPFLNWLVPKNATWGEVWEVNISLKDAHNYFSSFNSLINEQLERFENVYVSQSPVQPKYPDIQFFTGIKPFDLTNPPIKQRITFIWRQDGDRLWIRSWLIGKVCKRLKLDFILLPIHFLRARSLFKKLKRNKSLDGYQLTIAGVGRFGKFPSFIDDYRVNNFSDKIENEISNIYATSVVSIGIHGSSMLLPSLFSGMSISIMPRNRWGNFAQDIFIKPQNPLLEIFDRRIISIDTSISETAKILISMIKGREQYIKMFIEHALKD
jgi:hypothetical protein